MNGPIYDPKGKTPAERLQPAAKVRPGTLEPITSVVLLFPNETTVKISGDPDVVKQLVDHIDGHKITYKA